MFTIEKNDSGWYNVICDGQLSAVVPSEEAARKTIEVIRKRMRS